MQHPITRRLCSAEGSERTSLGICGTLRKLRVKQCCAVQNCGQAAQAAKSGVTMKVILRRRFRRLWIGRRRVARGRR